MFFKPYQKRQISTGSTNDKPEIRSLYDCKTYPHHNIFNFVVFFFGQMIDNFSNRADIIPFYTICSVTNSSTGFQNDSFVSDWSINSIQSRVIFILKTFRSKIKNAFLTFSWGLFRTAVISMASIIRSSCWLHPWRSFDSIGRDSSISKMTLWKKSRAAAEVWLFLCKTNLPICFTHSIRI